jgi:hypothetical protein
MKRIAVFGFGFEQRNGVGGDTHVGLFEYFSNGRARGDFAFF